MRLQIFIGLILLGFSAASAIVVPNTESSPYAKRDAHELWKRKGGGGGGGRGGGSSGGGSSSSGSSGSRGGSGSSSGSGVRTGPARPFGSGFYGGGARTPYKAGSRSPSGIAPILAVGALLTIWPAVWLYGAYHYPYTSPYRFHNDTVNEDQELPVICGCDPYNPCGCDENTDTTYLSALIGTGAYDQLDKQIVSVADVNGTRTLLINGTLPNGTTESAPTNSDTPSSAPLSMAAIAQAAGYWPMVAAACAAVFLGA